MGIVNQYIRSIELQRKKVDFWDEYPFSLPAIRTLKTLEMDPKVTFLVGENGSGKSTLLEAIATVYGFNPEGGTKNFTFTSKDTHSQLYQYVKLIKGIKKPKDGFFFRAESFYNLATNIEELDKAGMGAKIIDSYGGVSLHEQSHGESFFSVFMNRFSGKGLYILDEPEAALSPSRQMAMISRINELIQRDSQFIIATHSPIIMSYPEATIYEIKDEIQKVLYQDTEHYQVMKTFLNNTKRMLDILLK